MVIRFPGPSEIPNAVNTFRPKVPFPDTEAMVTSTEVPEGALTEMAPVVPIKEPAFAEKSAKVNPLTLSEKLTVKTTLLRLVSWAKGVFLTTELTVGNTASAVNCQVEPVMAVFPLPSEFTNTLLAIST